MLHVVLYQPEIPPNTGNIIRLCANTGMQLHLIRPFAFTLDDKRMRRAGLDYHEWANLQLHDDFASFLQQAEPRRCFGVSTKGTRFYHQIAFEPGDAVVLGPETRGLPQDIREHPRMAACIRIPMQADSRSLNLSNAAAILVYEAWRQWDFNGAV